jgi:hypothetical protein
MPRGRSGGWGRRACLVDVVGQRMRDCAVGQRRRWLRIVAGRDRSDRTAAAQECGRAMNDGSAIRVLTPR